MQSNKTQYYIQSAIYAVLASVVTVTMLAMSFFIAEPTISYGQSVDDAEFYIRQTIVDESSFLVNPANVTMAGDINGVTGGNATGTTYFVVQSNNSAGYYVEIAFEDNLTDNAMLGDVTDSEAIRDYGDNAGEPTFAFAASTSAQFGYTVHSSTTSDTDPSFLDDLGDVCNNGGTQQTVGFCWKAPTTAGFRIVERDAASVTGATTTLQFKVHVPNGAVPVPQAETYTATATLSLFVQ